MPIDRAHVVASPIAGRIGEAPSRAVANQEKKVPRNYITRGRIRHHRRLPPLPAPLIHGEDYPPYSGGLPVYVTAP